MDVNAPFYELGLLGDDGGLVVALVIGLAFGWFLERGGMGNARKLAGQFYGTDLTVFKMLFSAVVTAMLGLFWLSRLGVLDLSLVYLPPTFVLPQLLGGLVFGVGFVMGGLCPGTSCVAASSGRIDGLVLVLGMLFGVFLFNEAYPLVAGVYSATPMGQITIPDLIGRSHGTVLFVVVLCALAGFVAAERIEVWARGGSV